MCRMKFSKLQAFLWLLGALIVLVVVVVTGLFLYVHCKENRSGTGSKNQSFVVQKNITNDSVENYFLRDRNFVEIRDLSKESFSISDKKNLPAKKEFPKSRRFSSVVNEALKKLSYERTDLLIKNFSSFIDPDYQSDSGVRAVEWIIEQITQTIKNNSGYPGIVTIMRFKHSWKQPTVIVRFEGTDSIIKSEIVLLGVDLDTKYATDSTPGPGDNGGGSAVLLETIRILLETSFVPKRSIELHWYASGEEEREQRGQVDVAKAYTRSRLNVYSMVTFDTICYELVDDNGALSFNNATKKHLGKFPHDKTDGSLEAFLRKLVAIPYSIKLLWNIDCEMIGCVSYKTSWSAYGVTTAWPILVPCPMHPKNNTHTNLNIHRVLNFTRLATVYTIEMAEPNNIN